MSVYDNRRVGDTSALGRKGFFGLVTGGKRLKSLGQLIPRSAMGRQ
jgi:hypothetical protein